MKSFDGIDCSRRITTDLLYCGMAVDVATSHWTSARTKESSARRSPMVVPVRTYKISEAVEGGWSKVKRAAQQDGRRSRCRTQATRP